MRLRHRMGIRSAARTAAVSALLLSTAGCMTYRGPSGVEATIERKAGVQLHRETGFKLGPISTRIATSLVHHYADDQDFRDLTGIGFVVFEVTGHTGAPARPITAEDLGVEGWRPMFENRSEGEQLLVLAKTGNGEIREMMFLSIESDEVVVARLKGHLDRLIARTLAAADHDGAAGARAAIGVSSATDSSR
jgi:hypothetical protein